MSLAFATTDDGRTETRRLAGAFAVALALHVAALLAVATWRSTIVVVPPGEAEVTIDLAPAMLEAESQAPAELSPPIEEAPQAMTVAPPEATPAETVPPAEVAAPPLPAEMVAPEEATPQAPAAAAPVQRLEATEVLPPDVRAIESTAINAPPLPPTQTVTAEALPEPKPEPKPKPKPVAKPVERKPEPKPVRAPEQRRPRPAPPRAVARPAPSAPSARQGRAASSRENTGGAAAAADPNVMSRYAAQLAAALRARLRYPEAARAQGVSGVTTLRFTLHRSGRILASSVAGSAGNSLLDQAALATAPAGGSLPPAPDGLPQQQFTISVPLRFNLR